MPVDFLVFGAKGQVGSALTKLLGSGRVLALDYPEVDFAKPETLGKLLDEIQPRHIINAAAYTAVDQAESEEPLATLINADAPGALAQWCSKYQIPFVHYSTDYVFDGSGNSPWKETSPTAPKNAYGRSKLAGEQLVQLAGGKFIIFRTSWVYDATGKNFLKTMLRLGKEREFLRVVNDQCGAPTYAPHLARGTLRALEFAVQQKTFPSGIYHLCNSGVTHWCEFAEMIFKHAKNKGLPLRIHKVEPITTDAYPTPAKRPLNSRLDLEKAKSVLQVVLPPWQEGLQECMELIQ